MGVIRISDDAEERIKELSGGRTITATVDWLVGRADIVARLDKLAVYLEKQFAQMEKSIIDAINDTTIDRVECSGGRRIRTNDYGNLTWKHPIQDVYFDFPETDPVWLPGVYQDWANSDYMDQCRFYVEDEWVWADFFGDKRKQLLLTPELKKYLKAKMEEEELS